VTISVFLGICFIYILAVIRHGIGLGGFMPPPFVFVPPAPGGKDVQPLFFEEILPSDSACNMAHVSSICELSDGTLLAVWYGGSSVLAGDVAVYCTTRVPGESGWSAPRKIVDAISASRELRRPIEKVGNPVIWSDSGDRLYLLYVTAIGGWSTSSLNLKTSADGGKSWSTSVRLTLGPFLNFSELVRNRPIPLQNGGFMVPIHHETIGTFPEFLWLLPDSSSSTGFVARKTRINHSRGFLQPTVVTQDSHSAISFLRSKLEPRIGLSSSKDCGLTWQAPEYVELPNPNSAICAVRMSAGRLLMVFNDSEFGPRGRENLRIAVSDLQGRNWTRIATLEDAADDTFAYPYMIQTRDGLFHIVYSFGATNIKHVTFNEAWVEERIREAGRL
jgi:predicted neuraminidase